MDDIRHERLQRLRLSKAEWALMIECLYEAETAARVAANLADKVEAGDIEPLAGIPVECLRKQADRARELRSLALKVGMRMTDQHEVGL